MKKQTYDLGELEWTARGYLPYEWHLGRTVESGIILQGEVAAIPVSVPGSIQDALRKNGLIPDWEVGVNARHCEWVENRHWAYETVIPQNMVETSGAFRLRFDGLDHAGTIWLNGKECYRFQNAFLTHLVDVGDYLIQGDNHLVVVFECPPRWLGQFGYTPEFREWKARYNYSWDWTARLVQIGISGGVFLECIGDGEIIDINPRPRVDTESMTGVVTINGTASAKNFASVSFSLKTQAGKEIASTSSDLSNFEQNGVVLHNIPIELWWPNGMGEQVVYFLTSTLLSDSGDVLDILEQPIGFRTVEWTQAEGAPADADPWICCVNGTPVFLNGINWTPIRPNYADLTAADYDKRLSLYRDLGVNLIRIWGGGFLEAPWLYELCDAYGLMVWQEFPLSSSGISNYPPDDAESIAELSKVARSFIRRRRHHVSHIIWCGGNELSKNKERPPIPVDHEHPLIRKFASIVQEMDPDKRFLSSTPSGPSSGAREENYGRGIHWAVNGPWQPVGKLNESWHRYWENDDALMRSETGAPGPSSIEVIERYKGSCEVFPCSLENPLWRRSSWWIEWDQFIQEYEREPRDAEEYISWGQKRQSDALSFAAKCCADRFPRCGGIIIWMGHDSFPCTANTAIVDFEGNPKPAALALKKVFRNE